jgi:NADH-quinone oxidoreductase subunit K
MALSLAHFLVVGALLFALGLVTVATRRSAVGVLMGVELILNGANLNLVAFQRYLGGAGFPAGHVFALFVIVLAAAEAAVGLAIVLAVFQTSRSIDVRRADLLRE